MRQVAVNSVRLVGISTISTKYWVYTFCNKAFAM